jgi:hypothetical protein
MPRFTARPKAPPDVFNQPQATNLVDAAVARPVNDADVLTRFDIGMSRHIGGNLGMPLRKSGRTTGLHSE